MSTITIPILSMVRERLTNLRPIMLEISQDMINAVYKNFEEEGRPKWVPLAKSTIKQRSKKGYWPGRILQRRGAGGGLKGSIFAKYSDNSAVVGTNLGYAAIHQFGGGIDIMPQSETFIRKRNKKGRFKKGTTSGQGFTKKAYTVIIPARPFLYLSENEIESIKETLSRAILK